MAKAGGNYLNSQLVKMEARTDGYVEGITSTASGTSPRAAARTCS
jgi:branched-chain amino acid aminotransferase